VSFEYCFGCFSTRLLRYLISQLNHRGKLKEITYLLNGKDFEIILYYYDDEHFFIDNDYRNELLFIPYHNFNLLLK
jgi:hypothetical protein